MNRPLKVLLVHNSEESAALLSKQLQISSNYQVINKQIETVENLLEVLEEVKWNLIIADYNYRQLDYKTVLETLKKIELVIPLILIATEIDVEAAVSAIKLGVSDVVMKDNLLKLRDSIKTELSKNELRQQYCINKKCDKALDKLENAQKQLVETDKMSSLGHLVAGIAHEINNPANFISNNLNFADDYIQNLLKLLELYQQHCCNSVKEIKAYEEEIEWEFVREDLPKTLSSMKLGTERIRDLVVGLRNFSRKDQQNIQTANVHEIIDSVLLILQHRLKPQGKKAEIKIIKDYDNIPLVKCYPGQLNQVFMNLIANAIDALEEKMENDIQNIDSSVPYIKINTKADDNNSNLIIIISDNASGISSANQDKIFNTFFTTKAVGKGTGFGLSISHQIIVEKHRGKLECFSELGKGTEFRIEIPMLGDGEGRQGDKGTR